ncbi:unnamed protein product [Laminaria digitata]
MCCKDERERKEKDMMKYSVPRTINTKNYLVPRTDSYSSVTCTSKQSAVLLLYWYAVRMYQVLVCNSTSVYCCELCMYVLELFSFFFLSIPFTRTALNHVPYEYTSLLDFSRGKL